DNTWAAETEADLISIGTLTIAAPALELFKELFRGAESLTEE
ncbi:hypothetical protein HKBW3S03_00583, partial [Candidatus Hakubella thermalkaliphila]